MTFNFDFLALNILVVLHSNLREIVLILGIGIIFIPNVIVFAIITKQVRLFNEHLVFFFFILLIVEIIINKQNVVVMPEFFIIQILLPFLVMIIVLLEQIESYETTSVCVLSQGIVKHNLDTSSSSPTLSTTPYDVEKVPRASEHLGKRITRLVNAFRGASIGSINPFHLFIFSFFVLHILFIELYRFLLIFAYDPDKHFVESTGSRGILFWLVLHPMQQ
mmetsp:Transcript_37601/g.72851  ORF Transcript_37601/g.72851 Transcript_37601/m.72851 type:complete len:220 (-) Transcript_37601:5935-6594(-)